MKKLKNNNLSKLLSPKIFNEGLEHTQNYYRRYDAAGYLYEEILEKIKHESLNDLLKEDRFFELIYATLCAFNMNQRAAKLVLFQKFKKEIKSQKNNLKKLSNFNFASINDDEIDDILEKIKDVFSSLKIMGGQSQIVGISKTLHFLLPHLIMPIDRKYTLNFFYGNNQYNQERSREFKTFREVFKSFHKIALNLKLNKKKFNQPIPKIIDNAIIGFMNKRVYKIK